MTGMLGHVPAGEALALMWRDATGIAVAPQGGFVIFCLILGMPTVAALQVWRGRTPAVVSLLLAALCAIAWFSFYAYTVWAALEIGGVGLMVGWLVVFMAELLHWAGRRS